MGLICSMYEISYSLSNFPYNIILILISKSHTCVRGTVHYLHTPCHSNICKLYETLWMLGIAKLARL